MLPNGVLVVRQGLAPAALLFQLLTAAEQVGNLALRIRDGDLRRKLSQRGRRKQQCKNRKEGAEPNRVDPMFHDVVRRCRVLSPQPACAFTTTCWKIARGFAVTRQVKISGEQAGKWVRLPDLKEWYLSFFPMSKKTSWDSLRGIVTTGKAQQAVFAWQRLPVTLMRKRLGQTLPRGLSSRRAPGVWPHGSPPVRAGSFFPAPRLTTTAASSKFLWKMRTGESANSSLPK
jgi:hypothetical protein